MDERLRGHEWYRIRDRILERDNQECVNCGTGSNLVVHHIVPISNQGTNQMSNLATLCRDCHQSAHNHRQRDNVGSLHQPTRRSLPTTVEISNILQTVNHPLHIALIMTIAKTGIGVGEICNLNLGDVDIINECGSEISGFGRSGLRVRYGGNIEYNNRRERKQDTIVPIDDELRTVLKRWLAIRPDHPQTASFFTKTTESWGMRISPSTVRYVFEKVGQEHGLYSKNNEMKNFTPTSLRYFFEERFRGQPKHREYILGRLSDSKINYSELETDYRDSVFKFLPMPQTSK